MLSPITRKQYKLSVYILSAVCILYLVCGLQSAFCTDRIDIAVFVRASLKSAQKYWSSEKISLCSSALSLGHRVCWNEPATGPPRCTFRLLDSSCIFRSSQMWSELLLLLKAIQLFFPREFLNFIEINFRLFMTFTKWGGVAYKITSVQDPQFPSTTASPRYLIHCFQNEWAKNGMLVSIKSKLLDAPKNNWFKLSKN